MESSDGFVLSELAFFEEGITSLAPGGRIVCYWDELGNLQEMFQEERLQRGITVTVNYQDITGAPTLTRGRSIPYSIRASGRSGTGT